jgi:uncharacterized protein YyaL (SSP411 family)
MPNRLSAETSPYLLQHQHNPVDWYPWGPEAFGRARAEGKAIFLSVGYSTCYWCHVMERECFESPAIAGEMNTRFINIKVDREERPDVDQLYMTALQVLTKQGGWPMSVWLTPELRPFYAGTYFPPEDMQFAGGGGRPGFPRLLAGLEEAWVNRRGEVEQTANQVLRILHQLATPRRVAGRLVLDQVKMEEFIERSIGDYEPVHGGFGRAPKFPRQTLLALLLGWVGGSDGATKGVGGANAGDAQKRVRGMLERTLDAMSRGGIRDHLGGGFHRYSTDAKWLVPHFEIMLYDQAMLAEVYAVGARVLGRADFADVARGICDFVLREMTSPEGLFYTALDAEVDHHEGLNYLWTEAEIRSVLGAEDAAVFSCVYGVDQGPNFRDPHSPTATPMNVLFMDRGLPQAAHEHGYSVPELEAKLAAMRKKLKAVRDSRKQPLLDTKVITGWAGLMAKALVVVGRELGERRYVEAGARCCRELLRAHSTPEGRLYRTSRSGEARYAGFLDDYAALGLACILAGRELGDASLQAEGHRLAGEMLKQFAAESCDSRSGGAGCGGCGGGSCGGGGGGGGCGGGGLFFTSDDADDLIVRQKVATDSPLPSGNALAVRLLLEVGESNRARAILVEFAQALDDNAEGMSALAEACAAYVQQFGAIELEGPGEHREVPGDVEVEARWVSRRRMEVRLTVADGLHLYPDSAATTAKGLVGLRLQVPGAKVAYPEPQTLTLELTGESVPAYRGAVVLAVDFETEMSGAVRATLVYQACSQDSCREAVSSTMEFAPSGG